MKKNIIELNHNEKKTFSSILNKLMPKTFPWWNKIRIDDCYIRLYVNMNIVVIQSDINVDREWAEEGYYQFNDKRANFDDPEHEITLGDLYGSKTGDKVRENILNLFLAYYPGENVKEIRFYANVTFDDI